MVEPAATDAGDSAELGARVAGRALGWRATGTLGSKAIGVLRSIILARILAPDDFGVFAIAMVVHDLLMGVTDTGLNPALIQRARRDQRHYDVAWTLGVGRGIAIAVVIVVMAPFLARAFGDERASTLLQLLALRPLLVAFGSVRTADLERALDFRAIAIVDLTAALVAASISILTARSLGSFALVVGSLSGASVMAMGSYVVAPYRPRLFYDHSIAKSLFSFGRWVLAGSIVAMIGEGVFRAIIARTLGTAALGVYYLAANIAAIPDGFLGALVASVAFPVHSKLQDDKRRAAVAFRASTLGMFALLIPINALLIALAPRIVEVALDIRWADAVPVMRLLAIVAIILVPYRAAEPLLQGVGKPQWVAALYLVFALIITAVAWPLAGALGLSGAALARVVADSVIAVLAAGMAARVLDRPFEGLSRPVAAIAAAATVGGAIAFGASALLHQDQGASDALAFLALIVALSLGAAGGTLLALDRSFDLGLRRQLLRVLPAFSEAVWR